MDARDRGRVINKLADLIEDEIDELAALETLDNGKPIRDSAAADLPLTIDCLRYYAGYADKIHGQTIPVRGNYFYYTRREPVGVVGQIIPWNFPMLMVAWKWGPALAAGCTIVMKPAEQTPLTCLRMARLAQKAGIPDGVINVVPGYGPTAGARDRQASGHRQDRLHRLRRDGADHHARRRARRSNGSRSSWAARARTSSSPMPISTPPSPARTSACISIRASAAAPAAACSSKRKSTTSSSIGLPSMNKTPQAGRSVRSGDRARPASRSGAVRQDHALHRSGQEGRGRVPDRRQAHGGDRGYYIEPTLFADVKDDMAIAKDEIFGPVMSVLKFKDLDEIVARAQQHHLRPGRRRLDARHRQGPSPWPTASAPAPCGSTATTCSTPPPPSAASRCPAWAASSAKGAGCLHRDENGDGELAVARGRHQPARASVRFVPCGRNMEGAASQQMPRLDVKVAVHQGRR